MLCVDVLLDASASRVENQSEIAIQGYMLAKALEKLHLPVSVSCFHSLRSYTVLDQLKSYEDHDARKIFRYSAAGWNRDGLCLRLLKERIRKDDGHQHLVIVMTDAHPSDSTDMPPEEGSIFKRQYDGYAALQDTRNAVQELREGHIMVGAVFTGVAARLCNVSVIYGKEYIRVRKIQELSLGFCSLIQMMLREIRD
jgi:nitric oxide reductase activation protein